MLLASILVIIYITGWVAFVKETINQTEVEDNTLIALIILLNILWPVFLLIFLIQKAAS